MTPPEPNLVSLVIPVSNEAESLPPLFAEIDAAVSALGRPFEIIVVDDGSEDASWAAIARKAKDDSRYCGIRFRRNFGKAPALAAGFAKSHGRIVLTLDADLQDDPVEIPRFLAAIDGGLDVVSGWKKIRHDPWHKVFPSRVFNAVVSRVTGVPLHDHNCGFKAYRADALREIRLYGELHRFVPVLAAARGFRVGELVIHHRPRKFGHSHYGVRRFVKGFLDLVTVRFLTAFGRRPQHVLGSASLVPLLSGSIGIFAILIDVILRWTNIAVGMSSLMLIILAIFSVGLLLGGGLLFFAGLLAELIVERSPDHSVQYSIAETTPPIISQ
jgi:dolichol-phosphate mannosyltransferase